MTESVAFALAYLLDLIIADPKWLPHPVRIIGRLVGKYEIYLRERMLDTECEVVGHEIRSSLKNRKKEETNRTGIFSMAPSFMKSGKGMSLDAYERWAGVILAGVIAGATFISFYIISSALVLLRFSAVSSYISFGLFVYLISTTIATSSLLRSAGAVIDAAIKEDIDGSRKKLSMIVGRDTGSLDETGVLRAAIETLAENASDGIVAPMFYFAIGGLPLAMTYKAINTMDSMVGYKNEKYGNFGWAAARLDDVANYIPARVTALLIVASVYIINSIRYIVHMFSEYLEDMKNRAGLLLFGWIRRIGRTLARPDFAAAHRAFETMLRDGKKHPSPNAGYPEAAMAGAIGVRLGGPSVYEGKTVKKPYLGDTVRTMANRRENMASLYMKAAIFAVEITKLSSFLGFMIVLMAL